MGTECCRPRQSEACRKAGTEARRRTDRRGHEGGIAQLSRSADDQDGRRALAAYSFLRWRRRRRGGWQRREPGESWRPCLPHLLPELDRRSHQSRVPQSRARRIGARCVAGEDADRCRRRDRGSRSSSFEEAATLPCAGLTAWRAIAVEAPIDAKSTILVQGTGGVSIFALQFAKAIGAKVIATSSSDEKLERAKKLGADYLINYKTTPEWGKKALELTNGRGADVVVEVGGENTLGKSLEAVRVGGSIVVIGVLGGFMNNIFIPALFGKNAKLVGISVGSREQFASMTKAMDGWKLKPVIDSTFAFDQVPDALRAMQAAGHFGKICVKF